MPLDPSPPMTAARYQRSHDEHQRRKAVIAGGVNSNVRLAGFPVPLTIARADGALLWDVDGNEYLDYAAGMGPMILGHSHPAVNDAVCDAVTRGQLFAGQSELEPSSRNCSSAPCRGSRASGSVSPGRRWTCSLPASRAL